MNYYICGIGFVAPGLFGCGREIQSFDPKPGKLSCITRKDVLAKPYKPFGRMDLFSKVGFAATYFAYKDAGLIADEPFEDRKVSNTSIIVSTHYRCLDTDNDYFETFNYDSGKNASPALFAYALPNAFLGEASIFLKATGQCFAVNENNHKGITALKMTFDIINSGESEIVLCGICDPNFPKILENRVEKKDYNFSGSLFFTISNKKLNSNYGQIYENDNGNIIFNNKNIKNLLELAQVCIENQTNKMKDKLVL